MIQDPVFGYQRVNVETELENASSLLHWTRRMIHARKKHPAFGLGTFTDLGGSNPSVLSYVREYTTDDDRCCACNNLSRFPQPVELDLRRWEGVVPIELLGGVRFPEIGELPYLLTLGAYGFYWFRLPDLEPTDSPPARAGAARLDDGPTRDGDLEQYIETARWFGGKGRDYEVVRRTPARHAGRPAPRTDGAHGRHRAGHGADATADGRDRGLPGPARLLRRAAGAARARPGRHLGRRRARPGARLRRAARPRRDGPVAAGVRPTAPERRRPGASTGCRATSSTSTAHSTLFTGEQSNSSVAFGEDSLMKVFRRVTPGRNPDIEIHEALTEAGNEHVAALYGWVEAAGARAGEPPCSWRCSSSSCAPPATAGTSRWPACATCSPRPTCTPTRSAATSRAESHRLGRRDRRRCTTRSPQAFPTETWGADELRRPGRRDARPGSTPPLAVVPELAEHADGAARRLRRACDSVDRPVPVQRVHGDLHLGQTLRTVEGLEDRRLRGRAGQAAGGAGRARLPVARRRRHAALVRLRRRTPVEADVEADAETPTSRSPTGRAEWAERNRAAFLAGYVEASGRTEDGSTAEQQVLLRAYAADKAVYEAVYEARNRPSWLAIPLGA